MTNPVEELHRLLLLGVETDGEHHKQWCLDQALRLLEEAYYPFHSEHTWEPGTPP